MEKNMGSTDRTIRILVAVVIFVLYFIDVISGALAVILLILASIAIVTSLIGFCPLYKLLGISTNKKKE
ncbi:MAG: DUF2892 domain-containing protein [Bacteroidota bacterium]|nr:DUF2892 domain-containing protein [Bacteroidota bacterium]MDP4227658.1 DUF2892 domain-containing protein [Bacteroidota bacterium]MDP4275949.1 DUF2892 domain-containing protein [Bacteroidota bacterium]